MASLSSDQLSEQELQDLGNNFIRTQLVTIPGASVPAPYGGKVRIVNVDIDPDALYARGLSPQDVSNAILTQNVILPAGTAKIGTHEYDVAINSSPVILNDLNKIPIRYVNGATVHVGDVAFVHDGFQSPDEPRPTRRSPLRPAAHPEQRQRLDPVGRGSGAAADAQDPGRPAVEPQGRLPVRPERLRARGHHRGRPRRDDRRLPDRAHDPAVPGVLAEHPDRHHVDPPVDPDLHHHAQDPEPVPQRDDAGRAGAGGGHPGGRRHRRDREQPSPDGPGQAPEAGHPRRGGGGGDARVRRDPVDLHRVRADHVPRRGGRGAIRAAGDVRRLRDARQLPPLADARPDHGAVSAGARSAGARPRRRPRCSGPAITVRADLGLVRGRLPQAHPSLRGRPRLGADPPARGDRGVPHLRDRLAVTVPVRRPGLLPDRRCGTASVPRQGPSGDEDRADGSLLPAGRGLYPPGDPR